ncbi:MAG: T9SS type A sorting domain-containing protein, partial [Saprospiraceae bacterium]
SNCRLIAAQEPRAEALAFQLSPNPAAAGEVLVKTDFTDRSQGRLIVFDVFGKVVLEKTFDTAQLAEVLDLSGASPGLYFVRLDVGGRSGSRKLVLVRG